MRYQEDSSNLDDLSLMRQITDFMKGNTKDLLQAKIDNLAAHLIDGGQPNDNESQQIFEYFYWEYKREVSFQNKDWKLEDLWQVERGGEIMPITHQDRREFFEKLLIKIESKV